MGVTPSLTQSFWAGRRVLVTGHTGFKGSWLSSYLAIVGAKVVGYALSPVDTPNLFEQARVAERVESVIGDIRDLDRLGRVMRDASPEVVFHLAAQALVRASYKAPVETLAVNVMGTAHVLEAARTCPSVRAVVIVTTDKCYENREWSWGYREVDRLGGHDPYAASKACAELVTAAYRRSFFADSPIGIASARAGNVVGGGDWATDRIVPDLVRAALRRESLLLRNPKSTRPWQHVLDVVGGYMLLAERLHDDPAQFSGPWNFGPAGVAACSVSMLADMVCARWGDGAAWHYAATTQPHETIALALDSTKARTLLGWNPKLDVERSIEWTIDWYKAHRDARDLVATTHSQISGFQDLPC
jgi:CDP-glucose 4,6-dehydratase